MTEELEITTGNLLRQKKMKLAVAESCTGGMVCDRISNIPGSSDYFSGGIVSYSNQAKANLLGVRWETIDKFGAVSQEVVLEMAIGVRKVFKADIGISISGIAGPGGEMPGKPVGTTWIGLSAPDGEWARSYCWSGNRLENKNASAETVLQRLLDYLNGTLF
jgi:PncC family amidohydrolase